MNCSYGEIRVFDMVDVNDVAQGILGNCYFLASLSGLAEEPERVKSIFETTLANRYGKYSVRFFVQGVPVIMTVDDRFPCYNNETQEPLFSKPKGKELWALLIEKAWAKLYKSYVKIEAGTVEEALEDLTGAPSFVFFVDKETDDAIWEKLKHADLKKYVIGASSRENINKEATGIVENHAYTVVSVHETEGHKLVRIRNPWGNFEWKGDFSDSSALWTDSLKKAVQCENSENGIFYMSIRDFRRHYNNYSIHHYSDGWHYSFIEQTCDPKHASYFKINVEEPCEVYFRIHQKGSRFLPEKEQEGFKYSPASFMIVKIEKDDSYKLNSEE